MGRLGFDPEVRFTSSGQKVTTFRVAVHQRKAGKEETLWWRVTVWGENKLISHFKKGSSIIAVGEMVKPEIYTDREGKPQISLNMTAYQISFSPFGRTDRPEEERSFASGEGGQAPFSQGGSQQGKGERELKEMEMQEAATFSDDEIPF